MKLVTTLFLLGSVTAFAQLSTPNEAGVAMGHLHLLVKDIEQTRRLWIEGLGATPAMLGPMEVLKFPGVLVILRQGEPAGGTEGTVVNHLGFLVRDLKAAEQRWKSAGGEIYERRPSPTQVFLRFPGDVKVELTEEPTLASPVAHHHVHFSAPAVEEMRTWYVNTFGAKAGRRGRFEAADVPGANLSFSPATESVAATKGRGVDHIGFEVTNLEAFCKTLEQNGVKFDVPYRHVEKLGINIAFLTDPWGTYIELTEGLDKLNANAGQRIETVAGTGEKQLDLSEGPANKVNIGQPFGVEIGPDGALYITEVENHRVLRLDRKAGSVKTVAGSGKKGHSGDGGPATDAALNEPYEVRFDSSGNMYFVEMVGQIIRRVDTSGRIQTIAGTPGVKGFGGDGGPATKAQFSNPHSIVIDTAKNHLYVADIGNHRIRRIDLRTGMIETAAGNGEAKLPQAGVSATGNPMLEPRALYIERRNLWIALRNGHSVWRMDLDSGILEHIAGTGAQGYSGDGGPAKLATMNGPKGIAVEGDHAYVVDTENQVIRDIELKTSTIRTLAGTGPGGRGYGGDGGTATQAKMDRPHGICAASGGEVYIGDTNNHRVRVVR